MGNGTIPLNSGSGPGALDAEQLTVGSNTVFRERMVIAGELEAQVVYPANDVPAPGAMPYGLPVRSVPGPITAIETATVLTHLLLAPSALYTSATYDCSKGSVFSIFSRIDKTGLFRFQESHDGSNWETMVQIPMVQNVVYREPVYICAARYFRCILKNTGSSNATAWRLQLSQRFSTVGSRQSLQWPIYASTQTLGANLAFTPGDHFLSEAGDYPILLVYLKSDQDGSLQVRESSDGVTWLVTSYDYSGGSDPLRIEYRRTAIHLDVIYTNGPSAQTSFFFFASMANF